ncbi:hypothetical protein D9619_005385 [Psilocybe cf. subviscida]|uniref:Elongin-A n=1 Tax=Psilocybe cf. subviscida TaxID=2480587 RepID=A0A8H5FC29_9AGAR|nr:hypothetical protein D9619_005385 [Psilocybe cf. subviscida]
MDHDHDPRPVPSLVTLCQRAAMAHVDGISSLGDDLTYDLVKPILGKCSIEQLQRLEEASPHLYNATGEIWRDLCFRKFSLFAGERYSIDDQPQDPESWRSRYFALEIVETKRMEDAASKLRSKRVEGDERKKEKAVKYTDRLPPPKRVKTGSSWNFQPAKTLFQRARIDANKRHMALSTRLIPPPPSSRNYRVLPPNPRPVLPSPLPTNSYGHASSSRVTVNTVIHRRSTAPSSTSASTTVTPSHLDVPSYNDRPASVAMSRNTATCQSSNPNGFAQLRTNNTSTPTPLTSRPDTSPVKPVSRPPVTKKNTDPMSLMFLPKRQQKAPLQRPT